MGEGEGGRWLRLHPSLWLRRASGSERGAHAPEGEPLARRGVENKIGSPSPLSPPAEGGEGYFIYYD